MTNTLRTSRWLMARKSVVTAVESGLATTIAGPQPPSQFISIEGWRGGRIRFIANGTDGDTSIITIYDVNQDSEDGWQAQSLGTVTITLGTLAVVAGTIGGQVSQSLGTVKTTVWCDTAVWSATNYGTAMLARVSGNIAAFSPADNTIAELLVSDFGAAQGIALLCTTYSLTNTASNTEGIMPVLKLEV